MDDDIQISDPCPKCQHYTKWRECDNLFCGDGWIDLHEQDPMWYDKDDFEACVDCTGHGSHNWCPACGWDLLENQYLTTELARKAADKAPAQPPAPPA